jgi:EAL domain-containing protein (putative c-di-GMP-specific phosphodiesterase class I)
MTAQIPASAGQPSATLNLSAELEVREVAGDVEGIFRRQSLDMWRKPLAKALSEPLSSMVRQSVDAAREGSREPLICDDGRGGELVILARVGLRSDEGGSTVQFYRLEQDGEWFEKAEIDLRPDGLTDRDGFLDRAAMAMADGRSSMTMVEVQGGLDAVADAEFSRVVQEQARKSGASETSRLGNASYGILHGADTDEAEMFSAISTEAQSRGALADTNTMSAERIDGDGSAVTPQEIRATLSYSTGGFRDRMGAGLRRIGLGARHDEAKVRTAQLVVSARHAVKRGDLLVESRPVLSLKRSAVAMRQVRTSPVVDGKPVETEIITALADAPGFMAEMEVASVSKALEQQIEWKIWRAVSLRVMVSVRAEILEDRKIQKQLKKTIARHKVSAGKLLLRPYLPLGGDLSGKGDGLIERFASEDWRLAVPDFYAFIKGESNFGEASLGKREPSGYIEVAVDRLTGLAAQKDGEFLIRSLVNTWRERGTEIIATAADSASDLEFLQRMEIRHAKGMKIGDWDTG